jgi:hypothetical protein
MFGILTVKFLHFNGKSLKSVLKRQTVFFLTFHGKIFSVFTTDGNQN